MKKQYFTIFLIALCVVCFGLLGCKKYEPCKSPAYKPNSDNMIIGSEIVTVNGEKELRLWLDFEKFFQDNNIEVGLDDKYSVFWEGFTSVYSEVIEDGNVLTAESECGLYITLPKYNYYIMHIGLERNGNSEFFSQANYDSSFGCMNPLGGGDFISSLCFGIVQL